MNAYFFFAPNRMLWNNWQSMSDEQNNPGKYTTYVGPTTTSPASGYNIHSLQDYMGLPTV